MKYFYKFFQWTNGRKGTEWTQYLTFPIFVEDRLDETLDTAQVVLENVPIANNKPFPPKTKFKLERYLSADAIEPQAYWDYIVEKDEVELHVGVPNICTHRVHLIEASAVAQGMHVDNIALTYKLQDVSLRYSTVVSGGATLGSLNAIIIRGGGATSPNHSAPTTLQEGSNVWQNSYRYVWTNTGSLQPIMSEYHGGEAHLIEFTFPTLIAQGARNGIWFDICEAESTGRVIRRHYRGTTVLNTTTILTRTLGPTTLPQNQRDNVFWNIPNQQSRGTAAPVVMSRRDATTGLLHAISQLSVPSFFGDAVMNSPKPATISLQNANAQSKVVSFTTDILSNTQLQAGERYVYEIRVEASRASLPSHYIQTADVWRRDAGGEGWVVQTRNRSPSNNPLRNGQFTFTQGDTIYVSATTTVLNQTQEVEREGFLVNPARYNCHDLVRKALLTCGTKVFNNSNIGLEELEYPIKISDEIQARLQSQTMFETIFEQKNLWEVLVQVGHYLHAIPYLEFTSDGTDRFELKYRRLGQTELKENPNAKITIFNSQVLSDFFTQYDCYVKNLFSPQNLVEEWVVPKTSDSTFLISNNTAELHLQHPILEIDEMDILLGGQTLPILRQPDLSGEGGIDEGMIFEKSIYSILTPDLRFRPSKASSLYYTLGDNKIMGLNYTPPTVNNDGLMALKNMATILAGGNQSSLLFNTMRFRIKYRTHGSLRVSQVRPDIHAFMKNSSLEQYPNHNQFFGQQDKMVDSERFSDNLFGRLIRVANITHEHHELGKSNERNYYIESGELVEIDNERYYVMSVENELYPDAIFQKPTYSKNFNQLSNIVTIPSEPRFYEVSERSQVRREILMMDFLMLTASRASNTQSATFLNSQWRDFFRSVVLRDGSFSLPNYAYTRFKADERRQHIGSHNNIIPLDDLFPSVEIIVNQSTNTVSARPSARFRDVIVPLLHFPLKNAISFTWKMEDNFKAADAVDPTTSGTNGNDTVNDAYFSQQQVRYCDIFGRADLFDFRLFNSATAWTITQARRLPFAEPSRDFVPTEAQSVIRCPRTLSIGLDKDNREAITFNYQLNLIQQNNQYVTFPNLFGEKNGRLRMCLLNIEASLFEKLVPINPATIIADNVIWQALNANRNDIEIRITEPSGIDTNNVRSIILYDTVLNDTGDLVARTTILARNVADLPNTQKLNSWWIYPTFQP